MVVLVRGIRYCRLVAWWDGGGKVSREFVAYSISRARGSQSWRANGSSFLTGFGNVH